MAGSEPRGAGSPPPASDWGRLEAAILSGWRTFWYSVAKERATPTASRKEAAEETSALTRLPVSRGRRPRTETAAGRGPGPAGQPLPGLEELNTSLVLSLMSSEDLCPTAGLPHRQIDGIGSGVNFQLNNQQKFNILILYSTTRKERDRAREEHTSTVNKMFSLQSEGDEQQGSRYSVIPQIQKVCEVVDGFIYVANAEAHRRHEWQDEFSRIMAMTDPAFGSSGRPMLVLSCISQADVKRMPCFYLAHELHLSLLNHPWMVQDTEAETLTGFLNGIEWILEEVESKRAK